MTQEMARQSDLMLEGRNLPLLSRMKRFANGAFYLAAFLGLIEDQFTRLRCIAHRLSGWMPLRRSASMRSSHISGLGLWIQGGVNGSANPRLVGVGV